MRNRSKRCRQSGGLAAGACLVLLGAFALPAAAQTTDGSGLPSSSQYTPATPASTGYDAPYRLAPADACAGGTYGGSGAGAIITDLTARLAYRARGGALYSQSECTANAIELESGSTAAEGNVLICHENRFGPVCDDFWTDSATGVVCRQLGYATGFREQVSFFGALASTDYWLDDVRCSGTEANLSACRHKAWGDPTASKVRRRECPARRS